MSWKDLRPDTTHTQDKPKHYDRLGLEGSEPRVVDELCICGVVRSLHADTLAYGHGRGPDQEDQPVPFGSRCPKFRWAVWVVE